MLRFIKFLSLLLALLVLTLLPACKVDKKNTDTGDLASEQANDDGYSDYVDFVTKEGYVFLESSSQSYELELVNDIIYGENYPAIPKYEYPTGITSMKLADFDGNGETEMLVIGLSSDSCQAFMLANRDEKIIETSRVEFPFIPAGDGGHRDIFINEVEGKYIFGYEIFTSNSIWADGVEWTLAAYAYESDKLIEILNEHESGSAFVDVNYEDMLNHIKKAGFTNSGVLSRIIETEPQITVLCSVEYGIAISIDEFFVELNSIRDGNSELKLNPIIMNISVMN